MKNIKEKILKKDYCGFQKEMNQNQENTRVCNLKRNESIRIEKE